MSIGEIQRTVKTIFDGLGRLIEEIDTVLPLCVFFGRGLALIERDVY